MKKTLAILLSLALVICMIPGTAFATGTANTPVTEVEVTTTTGDPATSITAKYAVSLTGNNVTYNGSAQAPTVTLTAKTQTEQATPNVTLKLDNVATQETETVTSVTNAGTYKVLATIAVGGTTTNADVYVGDFTIAKYDLSKAMILIDDQVSGTSIPTNTLEGLTGIHYYYGTEKLASAGVLGDSTFVVPTIATTDSKTYTVSFAPATGKEGNFTGSLTPAVFDVVKDIAANTVKLYATNGTTEITQIAGGEYNATEKNVKGLFRVFDGTTELFYGKDFTLEYTDAKTAGTHVVTIKGMGNYGSSDTVNLVITPRDANTYVTYDAIPTQSVNTLRNVKPVLKDRYLGTTLVEGTDYQIKGYSGSAGTKGSVVIGFTRNYGGNDLTINFDVVSDAYNVETMQIYYGDTKVSAVNFDLDAFMYNGSSQPLSGITVYKNATDYTNKNALQSYYYTISYEYDKDGKTIATSSPVDAQDYRVYVVGQNGYAGKKLIGTYNIPKYNMDYVTITVGMGSAVAKPVVTVKSSFENIYFTEGKDYTMSYYVSSYTNKVLVTVTPTSTGNLTGTSSSEYYPIVAKSISTCSASFTNGKSSSAYTGSAISVPITVKDGYYTTLTEGTHYTVTYKDAAGKTVYSIKDAGTYTIEIAGKGMYDGKIYLYYTVTGIDISYYTVTLKESSVKATGYSQVPTITAVKSGYYSTLKASDYTVTYKNSLGQTVTSMSAPDTYTVVVTGKNGYQGSTTATFRIVGLDQTVTITNGTSKKVYADSDAFQITAKASGDGTGFTWTTSDPTVATVSSTGKVTIVGVGRAKITATTIGTKKYDPASGNFIVKVYPDKVKQTKKPWTDGKKGQLKVRWGYQDGVTKYQIRYSTTSSFKSYTTKTVNAHGDSTLATQSTTLKNLKSGKKYYIKVRAVYQMYNEEGTKITYYGAWSPWKSATTK